jgi:hypothetical protein
MFRPLLAEPVPITIAPAARHAEQQEAWAAELQTAREEARLARADLLAVREAERRGRWESAASLAGILAEKERLVSDLAGLRSTAAASAQSHDDRQKAGRVAFSCVLDDGPMLSVQCELWLNCLLRLNGISPSHVFIHAPVGCEANFLRRAKALGVNIVSIVPPDLRNPHCNKICQLETFMGGGFDHVVLMDCDTAWVGPMTLPHAAFHPTVKAMAKVVDRANPPETALSALFEAAGLGEPDWVDVGCPPGGGRRTDRNNCNGGLYILDSSILPTLHPSWRKWALWCLDREDDLGRHVRNADQLGFALALRERGLSVTPLPIEWNYPTHLPASELPDVPPRILHYHNAMTPDHRLVETGVARPDAAIRKLNGQIAEFDRVHPANGTTLDGTARKTEPVVIE